MNKISKKKKKIPKRKRDKHQNFSEKKRHRPKKFQAKLHHILRNLRVI